MQAMLVFVAANRVNPTGIEAGVEITLDWSGKK